MLITKDQIEEILNFHSNQTPITSLYLNVDPARYQKEEYLINLKTMVKEKKEKLEQENLNRDAFKSALQDFDKIMEYTSNLKGHTFKGLVIFSCSDKKLFQVFELDEQVKDRLVVDGFPYTRPLFSILRLMVRYLVLLFKKDKLRLFEVFGDRIKEQMDLFTKTLFSSRQNDYIFINEKKMQNRKETEYYRFLRESSDAVLDFFMKRGADYIFIGGEKQVAHDFHKHMHSYLRERFAGFLEVPFDAQEKEVFEEIKKLSLQRISQMDRELLDRIKQEISKQGDACSGIEEVLKYLSMGAVSILAVEEGFTCPGYIDEERGILYTQQRIPEGQTNLTPVSDLINELVDFAVHQGAEVRIIKDKNLIQDLDHIAALLRFKV